MSMNLIKDRAFRGYVPCNTPTREKTHTLQVFAPVRENDITKAKTFQCLGKRTSLKLFLQKDIMNLYQSEEEISQTVLKFEVPKETFILP